jgi:hypothetical protein
MLRSFKESMTGQPHKPDWFKFGVHFVFGALLGSFLGCRAWGRSDYAFSTSILPGFAFIGGGALVVGLIAGFLSHTGWDERLGR